MPCKICGKELPEGVSVCEECGKSLRPEPIKIEETDEADLILIEKKSPQEWPEKWQGIYTEEQRADIRHLWGLDNKQIDLLQEAQNFRDNLLKTLGIRDPHSLKLNDPRIKTYLDEIEAFLRERNLWQEVIETQALFKDGIIAEALKKEKPFGLALWAVLRLVRE